jgi:hypothetical protein
LLATFDLEQVGDMVRLTLTRDGTRPVDAEGTHDGWAKVLFSLKSFLETGRPLGTLL